MTESPRFDPFESLPANFETALKDVCRRYVNDIVPAVDYEQHCWLWIAEHPRAVAAWWYDSPTPVTNVLTTKFSWYQARRQLGAVCQSYGHKERIVRMGLDPKDQATYTKETLERFLPYVWHTEALSADGVVQEGPRAASDQSKTGNAMVSAIDVRAAYAHVVDEGSLLDAILYAKYGLGFNNTEIADRVEGVERTGITAKINNAIDAMVSHLSGPIGFVDPLDEGHWGDGPGTRTAISNSEARNMLEG